MYIVFAIIILAAVVILMLLQILWILIGSFLLLVVSGVAIHLMMKERRTLAILEMHLQEEAKRVRELNAKEFAAWQSVVRDDQRNIARRAEVLRSYDASTTAISKKQDDR